MHCLTGLAPYVLLQAVEHGVEVVHTATSTLANAASHPPTELVARNLRRRGYDAAIDIGSVAAAAEKIAYLAEPEGKPTGAPVEYEEYHFPLTVHCAMHANRQTHHGNDLLPARNSGGSVLD